ncbi:thiol-disulfide isomerase/thioredoxin [Pedobacter africanus]|uniref:Thiol-disulfide isomerase/thioredoxin n=1 Tax=Pedobacter africanus TaxID=151894 RepID=A0ACC6L0Y4_9SPHI|nr:thioredoxin domain-containing protein [Pedobacter africanus]MDR6785157.1 thiol-disulfide isomerase/thioredoxin [Pedobacter africanus]
MKRYLLMIMSLLFTAGTIDVRAQGITFAHGSWAEVKAMAKEQNKLIFVDFYTDWCAPCKKMSMEVFPQKAAGDFYNANFIAYKVNAEKGEGPVLAREYGVSGYPTLAYINFNGEVIHRLTSSTDVKELIEQGKMALTPRNDYEQLKIKFAANELGKEDLYRYYIIVKTKGDAKEAMQVFDRYFEVVATVNAETFDLIKENVSSTDSKPFKYLEQQKKEFSAALGRKKIESYIRNEYLKEFRQKVWYNTYKTTEAYEQVRAELTQQVKLTEKEQLDFDADFYMVKGDEDRFVASAGKLIDKYCDKDDVKISNILGGAVRIVKKQENLLVIKKWAEKALSIKNNFINNATLAMVYKSLKNKHMAIKYIDVAIEQCRLEKNGYEERAGQMKKEIASGN